MKEKIILFVCRGNSGRSQMAEAFFNRLSKKKRAISAGIKPDDKIHPWTKQLMKEMGIDIKQKKPRVINEKLLKNAERIIILDFEVFKDVPKKYLPKLEEWRIKKLKGKTICQVRKIRDQLEKRVKIFIENEEKNK